MYIYNVTTNLDESIHSEWLNWMKEIHMPKVISAGNFIKGLMTQVLVKEEMGGYTYSVQYTCNSKELLEKYFLEEDQKLQNEGRKKFDNKFGSFTTIMKVVAEIKK